MLHNTKQSITIPIQASTFTPHVELPATVAFGMVRQDATITKLITLSNTGDADAHLLFRPPLKNKDDDDSEYYRASSIQIGPFCFAPPIMKIAPGTQADLSVSYTAVDLDKGDKAQIVCVDHAGTETVIELAGQAMVPNLELLTPIIEFELNNPGIVVHQEIRLMNHTAIVEPFQLTLPPNVTAIPATGNLRTGLNVWRLSFTSNEPMEIVTNLQLAPLPDPILVKTRCEPFSLHISPPFVDLNDVIINTPIEISLSLTNTSHSLIQLPFTKMAPQSSYTYKLKLHPDEYGELKDVIRFPIENGPCYEIPYRANVVYPKNALVFNPPMLDFGCVHNSKNTSTSVQLINTTNSGIRILLSGPVTSDRLFISPLESETLTILAQNGSVIATSSGLTLAVLPVSVYKSDTSVAFIPSITETEVWVGQSQTVSVVMRNLTPLQTYAFDNILESFGEVILKNELLITTPGPFERMFTSEVGGYCIRGIARGPSIQINTLDTKLDYNINIPGTQVKTIRLVNTGKISANWSAKISKYFPGRIQDDTKAAMILQRTPHQGFTSAPQFAAEKERSRQAEQLRANVLANGLGCAFVVQPSSGTLAEGCYADVNISAFANHWGTFQDTLLFHDNTSLPIHCTATGTPFTAQSINFGKRLVGTVCKATSTITSLTNLPKELHFHVWRRNIDASSRLVDLYMVNDQLVIENSKGDIATDLQVQPDKIKIESGERKTLDVSVTVAAPGIVQWTVLAELSTLRKSSDSVNLVNSRICGPVAFTVTMEGVIPSLVVIESQGDKEEGVVRLRNECGVTVKFSCSGFAGGTVIDDRGGVTPLRSLKEVTVQGGEGVQLRRVSGSSEGTLDFERGHTMNI